MPLNKPSIRKRPPRRNLVAIDGTLDALAKVRMVVKETGINAEPFDLHIAHKESVREHVDCNNPACFGGGFSLGDVLREMVRGRQEEFIGTSFCTGQEGDPEVELIHPSCGTRFEIQAVVRYR